MLDNREGAVAVHSSVNRSPLKECVNCGDAGETDDDLVTDSWKVHRCGASYDAATRVCYECSVLLVAVCFTMIIRLWVLITCRGRKLIRDAYTVAFASLVISRIRKQKQKHIIKYCNSAIDARSSFCVPPNCSLLLNLLRDNCECCEN